MNTKSASIVKDTSSFASINVAIENNTTYKYNVNIGMQVTLGIQFSNTDHISGLGQLVGDYAPITRSSSFTITNQRNYDLSNRIATSSTAATKVTYGKSGNTGT